MVKNRRDAQASPRSRDPLGELSRATLPILWSLVVFFLGFHAHVKMLSKALLPDGLVRAEKDISSSLAASQTCTKISETNIALGGPKNNLQYTPTPSKVADPLLPWRVSIPELKDPILPRRKFSTYPWNGNRVWNRLVNSLSQ